MKSAMLAICTFLLLVTSTSAISWFEHDIVTYYPDVEIASVADLNSDGYPDVIAVSQQEGPITWWENVYGHGVTWEQHFVNDVIDGVYSLPAADIDNDGDMDVVCDSRIQNQILWFENDDGSGLSWTEHYVDDNIDNPRWLILSDLDQDGDQDVIGTAYGLGIIYWWENDGNGVFDRHMIDDVGDDLSDNPNCFSAADIDNDGDLDIFATISSYALYWYENDGTQSFTRNVIDVISHPTYEVVAVDVDLDGDLDAIAAKAGLRWFENVDGTGDTWTNHEIAVNQGFHNLTINDFDENGYPDVIARTISQVVSFENFGGGTDWRYAEITESYPAPGRFDSGDIDSDGDLDLAIPFRSDNDLVWLEMMVLRPQQPFDLHVSRMNDTMQLIWNAESGEDPDFVEYRVYRDDALIASTQELEYVDLPDEYGLHDWYVTALYADGESEFMEPVSELYPDPLKLEIDENFDDGLPTTWSIEYLVATLTWHIDDGSEHAYYPTPYMLMDSGPGNQLHDYLERLITPEIEVSEADQVLLLFDQTSNNNNENHLVQWSADEGDNWHTITEFQDFLISREILDLTNLVQDDSSIWISWYYYDVDNSYSRGTWGVEDVTVYVDRDAGPVRLTVEPIIDLVPVEGGEIEFDVHLYSVLSTSVPNVAVWRTLLLPNGQVIQPPPDFRFTLPANADLWAYGATQTIPAIAPGGQYQFTLNVGFVNHPQLQASDSFQFTKLGQVTTADTDFIAEDWPVNLTFSNLTAGAGEASLPAEWSLGDPYPNPFNSRAAVQLTLPETSWIYVAVYNILGQHVVDIVDGQLSAGRHTLTIDGSSLPSGIYFLRTSNGEDTLVRKIMLLK